MNAKQRLKSEVEYRQEMRKTASSAFIPTYSSFREEIREWIEEHHKRLSKLGICKVHRSTAIRDIVELAYHMRGRIGL